MHVQLWKRERDGGGGGGCSPFIAWQTSSAQGWGCEGSSSQSFSSLQSICVTSLSHKTKCKHTDIHKINKVGREYVHSLTRLHGDKLTAIRSRVPLTAAHRSCRRSMIRMKPTSVDDKLRKHREATWSQQIQNTGQPWYFRTKHSLIEQHHIKVNFTLTGDLWRIQYTAMTKSLKQAEPLNEEKTKKCRHFFLCERMRGLSFCHAALYLLRQLVHDTKEDTLKHLKISWLSASSPLFSPWAPFLCCPLQSQERRGAGFKHHWQSMTIPTCAAHQQNPLYIPESMHQSDTVSVCQHRNIPVISKYLRFKSTILKNLAAHTEGQWMKRAALRTEYKCRRKRCASEVDPSMLFKGEVAECFRPSHRSASAPPAPHFRGIQWVAGSWWGMSLSQGCCKVKNISGSQPADLYSCGGGDSLSRGHCKPGVFGY